MNNPYAPPTAKVGDIDDQKPEDFDYAGFWWRVLASIIDNIVLGIAIGLVSAGVVIAIHGFSGADSMSALVLNYVTSTVLTTVAIVLFWKFKQGSPGKLMLSMRIVDAETLGALSWGQCIGRYFSYVISFLGLCIGFMWVGWDARKQGWHDKLAGTVVIRVYK